MPRKGHIVKRDVLPDPIYQSKLVTRIVNTIMVDGKKGTAQGILYGAFNRVKDATGHDLVRDSEIACLPTTVVPQGAV